MTHRTGTSMLPLSRPLFDRKAMSLATVSVAGSLLVATLLVLTTLARL